MNEQEGLSQLEGLLPGEVKSTHVSASLLTRLYEVGSVKSQLQLQQDNFFRFMAMHAMMSGYMRRLRRKYPWNKTISGSVENELKKMLKTVPGA